jgi:hypothetical protein
LVKRGGANRATFVFGCLSRKLKEFLKNGKELTEAGAVEKRRYECQERAAGNQHAAHSAHSPRGPRFEPQ